MGGAHENVWEHNMSYITHVTLRAVHNSRVTGFRDLGSTEVLENALKWCIIHYHISFNTFCIAEIDTNHESFFLILFSLLIVIQCLSPQK